MTRHVRRWMAVPMILGLVFVTASCSSDDEGRAAGDGSRHHVDVTADLDSAGPRRRER